MTLKSIELSGFKSFGKKSTLSFNTPITSVVGPNGSGKSNIVEAIRFVLGEQSMKSLRGKGGIDLIFKGSKMMPSASRASVTITFDNSKKIFNFTNSGLGVSLDFDEISISREVFADGGNTYSINSTEVRLKDVVDLLASVNIGSSGHHIISQGEADRVLNASPKDRRAMIEDALGLKVYQYRIKESERKLEKTAINMKEVQSIRREIAPHIAFLKKQVEKVEKSHALRDELNGYYGTYLATESAYIALATKELTHKKRILDEKLLSLEERLSKLPVYDTGTINKESDARAQLAKEEVRIRRASEELSRTRGRLEGMIDALRAPREEIKEEADRVISYTEWASLLDTCLSEIDSALGQDDKENIVAILSKLKTQLLQMKSSESKIERVDTKATNDERIAQFEQQKEDIVSELEGLEKEAEKNREMMQAMQVAEKEVEMHLRDSERVRYEILGQKNEVSSDLHSLSYEQEKLENTKLAFEMEVREASTLIGMQVLSYAQKGFASDGAGVETKESRILQEELKRKIERIKIKLEDAGIGNGADILKEYNETIERDQFLERELGDLSTSSSTLQNLINELKETLDTEFKEGVNKINKEFQNFFSLMFGGGSAHLSVVVEQKRAKKDEDLDMEGEETEEENFELEKGVNIDVSLPQKKVKDLHMLSGGERSLTSIALLFAMSQVNPPPFLVLDETDAALDEANSRKYGDMLENLSKFSQLIVVTHNRETMSRAEVLYGVTVGADGASKLLSISLVDANAYAK